MTSPRRGRSCILTYHSLDTSGSVISTDPRMFRQQMDWLAETGTTVVPLEQIQHSPGAVALTFDDGFQNFYEHAFPVLREHGFPATVFVVTGFCGSTNSWPSQPASPPVPRLPLMGWSQLREIASSKVNLGSHTCTHPHLPQVSASEVEEELRSSRASLEDRVGQPVASFAYPYGASNPHLRASVSRHYRLACGTKLAYLSQESDATELPRLDTYYLQKRMWFQSLSRQYGVAYIAMRRSLRDVRVSWSKA
jgi:peptidoglycan/xylan/chitin deacetylase (PgdA/CDA1 family)